MSSARSFCAYGSVAPCGHDVDSSQCSKRTRYLLPELPEEIWHYIHSLVPLRDPARAACVSHAFRSSWECHPNLTFTMETMCSQENIRKWTEDSNDKRGRNEYYRNIHRILANHRGTGVKTCMLDFYGPYNTKSYDRLNDWLQIAVTPGIEELSLSLLSDKSKYDFPCAKDNYRKWTEDSNDKRGRREYNSNIEHIQASHRGASVKTCMLRFHGPSNTESYDLLNSLLQIALTPVLEDFTLSLLPGKVKYDFPCSLLSDRSGNMIRYLRLGNCVLRPTVNLGLRCLTELDLYKVCITGDELGRLLSDSFALEKLVLRSCCDIMHLEIPYLLHRLRYVEVFACWNLQIIDNKAPNMSSFQFTGDVVQLLLGESLQVKNLKLDSRRVISTAICKLPSSVPNLETLTLRSHSEINDAPVIRSKIFHLKVLSIYFRNWSYNREYDFLSLVSFLDASPSLETLLSVGWNWNWNYDLVVGDPSTLRQMPERHHDRLKDVKITGFCPEKNLVELTRHILESATSLKFLILDAVNVYYRCSGIKSDRKCSALDLADIKNVRKSVVAIKTYIEGIVPSTVQLQVLEPCSRCHAL